MALRIQLSDNEKMLVQRNRLKHEKVIVRRKMDVLWLLHHGHTRAEAAVITGVARGTVQRYVADYRDGGLEALFRIERPVPVSEMEDHRDVLPASFRETPVRSVAEAAERIGRLRTGESITVGIGCHPERSEGSPYASGQILRYAQDDRYLFSDPKGKRSVAINTADVLPKGAFSSTSISPKTFTIRHFRLSGRPVTPY